MRLALVAEIIRVNPYNQKDHAMACAYLVAIVIFSWGGAIASPPVSIFGLAVFAVSILIHLDNQKDQPK